MTETGHQVLFLFGGNCQGAVSCALLPREVPHCSCRGSPERQNQQDVEQVGGPRCKGPAHNCGGLVRAESAGGACVWTPREKLKLESKGGLLAQFCSAQ